jgi:hypothetical protein
MPTYTELYPSPENLYNLFISIFRHMCFNSLTAYRYWRYPECFLNSKRLLTWFLEFAFKITILNLISLAGNVTQEYNKTSYFSWSFQMFFWLLSVNPPSSILKHLYDWGFPLLSFPQLKCPFESGFSLSLCLSYYVKIYQWQIKTTTKLQKLRTGFMS